MSVQHHAKASAKPGHEKRFDHRELDLLRFIAFCGVFFGHLAAFFTNGGDYGWLNQKNRAIEFLRDILAAGLFGVDLFFCLSAFLITTIAIREIKKSGTLDIRKFWMRRILRIAPLYYFALVLMFVITHLTGIGYSFDKYRFVSFAAFLGNWNCVFFGVPTMLVGPLWSVSLEMQFYLLWPLALSCFKFKRLFSLAFLGLLVSSASRILFACFKVGHGHPAGEMTWVWMSSFSHLDPIAGGIIFAVWIDKRGWQPKVWQRWCLGGFALLVPAPLLYSLGSGNAFGGWHAVILLPVMAVCAIALLGSIYSENDGWVPHWTVYLGRISYGLYVFHMLSIQFLYYLSPFERAHGLGGKIGHAALLTGGALALDVLLAAASYQLIEKQFLRLKNREFTVVPTVPADLSST